MATAPRAQVEGPQQLWLDVARPIAPREPLARATAGGRKPRAANPHAGRQMELQMAAATATARIAEVCTPASMPARPATVAAAPLAPEREAEPARAPFVTWLLDQVRRGGTIGELAKAARLDPLFPRNGDADAVRARFSTAGADGDAFAALDDAERAYDRAA